MNLFNTDISLKLSQKYFTKSFAYLEWKFDKFRELADEMRGQYICLDMAIKDYLDEIIIRKSIKIHTL